MDSTFSLSALLPEYHEITLPTNGNLYGEAIPAVIHVRGMTVRELKHLTATGKLDKRVLDSTLSKCIKEPIKLSDLVIEDYNYIIYMIRLHSSGTSVTSGTVCSNPACSTPFKFTYYIDECADVKLAETPLEATKVVHLPRFDAQGLNVEVTVKRLTRADIIAVDDVIRRAADLAAKTGTELSVYPLTEFLKAYIVKVNGLPTPVPKDQLIDFFNSQESELISNAFSEEFGVSGKVDAKCPLCKTTTEFVIPFTDLFFL